MSPELILLIERLVLSPTVQDAAWALIKTELMAGRMPGQDLIAQADALVDQTHASVQALVGKPG